MVRGAITATLLCGLLACGGKSPAGQAPPVARLSAPAMVFVGEQFTADASASSGLDAAARYSFDFRDGTMFVQSEPIATHAYRQPGAFGIALTVTSAKGASDTVEKVVNVVVPRPPAAQLQAPPSALLNVPVRFDAGASHGLDGKIVTYSFDFGDGSPVLTQSDAVALHSYSHPAIYHYSFTVTDDRGNSSSLAGDLVGGFVFSTPVNMTTRSQTISDAWGQVMAVDGTGNVDMGWVFDGTMPFRRYLPSQGGALSPISIAVPNSGFHQAEPTGMVATPDSIIHVVGRWVPGSGYYQVFYLRSQDGGNTFTRPNLLSLGTAPSLATKGSNELDVLFLAQVDSQGDTGLFFTQSLDGGGSFSKPAQVGDNAVAYGELAHGGGDNLVIASLHGTAQPQVKDVQVYRSGDAGKSFSAPVSFGCTDVGPFGGIAGLNVKTDGSGVVLVSWLVAGPPRGVFHLMLARSTDEGLSWEPVREIAQGPHLELQSTSMAPGGDVYIVYSTFHDGEEFVRPKALLFSGDGGATFAGPLPIPQMPSSWLTFPKVLALPNHGIALTWTYEPDGAMATDMYFSAGFVSTR